jgi:hypothetical protein
MAWLGIAMMVVAVAVYVALIPWGGQMRLKSESAQAFGLMGLMLTFILGAVFALGLY